MNQPASRKTLVLEGIQKAQTATALLEPLKSSTNTEIKKLAQALHYLAFGMQEIALALSDESRDDDLPIQRAQ